MEALRLCTCCLVLCLVKHHPNYILGFNQIGLALIHPTWDDEDADEDQDQDEENQEDEEDQEEDEDEDEDEDEEDENEEDEDEDEDEEDDDDDDDDDPNQHIVCCGSTTPQPEIFHSSFLVFF